VAARTKIESTGSFTEAQWEAVRDSGKEPARHRAACVVGADDQIAVESRKGGDVLDELELGASFAQVEMALVIECRVLVSLAQKVEELRLVECRFRGDG
jgi:hypothetical protein